MTAEAAAAATAPARKRSPLLLIVLGLVAVLAGAGGAGWFFFYHPRAAAPPAAHVEEARPPAHVLRAGTVVINIAGTEGKRFLRTTVEVGASAKDAKHLEELKAPLVDAAIEVLSTKGLNKLLEPERNPLREELKQRFNTVLGHQAVTHVYLTEFIIQ